MIEVCEPAQMRRWTGAERAAGRRVGFVPTMGALHEGHLRLVDRARELSDTVVVSVFVNPLQFGPDEDFDRYPRDLAHDREHAARRGVDCLFVPSPEAMYPTPPVVTLDPGRLAARLCGPFRPGHFGGVLTVVAKLFHVVTPDVAVFGRKDAQQARLIAQMVRDLQFPVDIEVAPTVREADGLALSSRNAYLTSEERKAALALHRALDAAHAAFDRGVRDAPEVVARARAELDREALVRLQYLEAVDPVTLEAVSTVSEHSLVAVAAHVGRTRLIDNIVLGLGTAGDIRLDPAA